METDCAKYKGITENDAQTNDPIIRKCAIEKAKNYLKKNGLPNVDFSQLCSKSNKPTLPEDEKNICNSFETSILTQEEELREQLRTKFESKEKARDNIEINDKFDYRPDAISEKQKATINSNSTGRRAIEARAEAKAKASTSSSGFFSNFSFPKISGFGRGGKRRKMESKKKKRKKNKNKSKTKSRSRHSLSSR